MNTALQFQVGQTYSTRSICDHNCIFSIRVLSRTEKTITVDNLGGSPGHRKVLRPRLYEGVEQVKPNGTHSMCAVIGADARDLS